MGVQGAIDSLTTPILPADPPSSIKLKDVANPSKNRVFSIATPIPLSSIKRAKDKLGMTVNDVLTAAFAAAVRNVLEEDGKGAPIPHPLRMNFPINLRTPRQRIEDTFGNMFGTGMVDASLANFSAKDQSRLASAFDMQAQMRGQKLSWGPSLERSLIAVGNRFLGINALIRVALRYFGTPTMMISNVIGASQAQSIGGIRCPTMHYFLVLPVGVYCGMMSYGGNLTMSVAADASLGLDPTRLSLAFSHEFSSLAQEVYIYIYIGR